MGSQHSLGVVLQHVHARRGSYVESTHSLSACVANADGEILYSFGELEQSLPVRSLVQPFIAAAFVRGGEADAYGLGEIELALAAGSHDGEERHVASIRAFLHGIGLTEEYLLCGPAQEGKLVIGPPAGHSCSGKHTALLAQCRRQSLDLDTYTDPDHPLQRELLPELFGIFGRTLDDTPLATDGCGLPTFGATLAQIATAYARLGVTEDAAQLRVRDAMALEPGYVGGWFGNLDTRIITWTNGAIISKCGAEGLTADALVGKGIGIALKVHDGNARALSPVLAQLFGQFAPHVTIRADHLAELATPALLNASGRRVGDLAATDIPGVDDSVHRSAL